MTDDVESLGILSAVAQIASTLLWLVADGALLVVALTVVRRARPDVSGLLATAAVIMLLVSLCSPLVSVGASVLGAREGPGTVVRAQLAAGLLTGTARLAGFAMVIAAIARLASRRESAREPG